MRAAKTILFLWALLFAAPAWAQADNLKIMDCLVVSATPYTFSPGQAGLVQCDTQGRIILAPSASTSASSVTQATSPWVDNISQFGGSNVVTGTGASGAGIPRVTVSSDSFPSIQPVSGTVTAQQPASTTYAVSWTGQTVAATQSGTWNTNLYIAGAANANNNPAFVQVTNFPATQAVSGTVTDNQGTPAAVGNAWPTYLAQGGAAISSTNPIFEQTVGPSMNAPGTSGTIARSVQGVTNGVPLPVTGTVGSITYATATSAAPSYTNNQTALVSQTLAGALRVDASATTQPVLSGYYINALPSAGTGYGAPVVDKRSQWKVSETGSDDALVGITPVNAYGASADSAKTAAGNLYYAMAGNGTSTLGYVIEYDAASTPSAGATLTNSLVRGCHLLPASGVWEPARNPGPPKAFANGIQILLSSTSCFGSTIVYTTSTAVTGFIEADVR